MPLCPACLGDHVSYVETPAPHCFCPQCRHRWQEAGDDESHRRYYSGLSGRNNVLDPAYAKKIESRLVELAPLLQAGMRVLEIGCADGDLGRRVKQMARVNYTGVELSGDALVAQGCLDRVIRAPAGDLHDESYDLILSYHVLEHISDVRSEVGHWHRLLKPSGSLVLEVPNEAGHALLSWDGNPEHRHHFTASSLSTLLDHAGFSIQRLSAGHFESIVYSDSLRVLARPQQDASVRRTKVIEKFRDVFSGPFVVYGVGGDFRNYVAPFLSELQVAGLADSDPACHGESISGLRVGAFDPVRFAGYPVLIASGRYRKEITATLVEQGVPPGSIHGLDSVFA